MNNTPRTPALALIILTNTIPLLGILMWNWELRSVLLLYWTENIILGAYTLLRLLTYTPKKESSIQSKIGLSLFFTVHYGTFCFVHLIFLTVLTSGDINNPSAPPFPELSDLGKGFTFGILSMIAFQFYDYITLFIQTGQYKQPGIKGKIMSSPYKHIVVIHIAIILGAFLALALKTPIAILVIVIIGKTLIDLKAEKRKTELPSPSITQTEKLPQPNK